MIRRKIWKLPAPSMRAASSSSLGMPTKKLRIRKMFMMLTQPGQISALMSLTQPKALQILNSGSVEAEDGISEMKNTAQKILSPAGKRSRSKENAASDVVNTTTAVRVTEMMTELVIIFRMPVVVDIPSPVNSET